MKKKFNLEEEIIDGYKVSKEMKQIWNIEFEMLKELIRVCEKHNLKFVVDSGTLLGTVRHKGFIPWDDDIDVVMLREDYDKLLALPENEFKYPIFLQSAYSDKGYFRGHAQLRNSMTTGILPYEAEKVQFNQGIFIDIFPLDEMSKFEIINKFKCYRVKLNLKKFRLMFYKDESKNKVKRFMKKILYIFLKNLKYKKMYKKFERKLSSKKFKNENVAKVSYYQKYKNYIPLKKEYFEEIEYLPFEDIMVPVPKKYDEVLKIYYGENYMMPVRGTSMHGTVIFDVNTSYIETLKNIEMNKTK